MSTESYSNFPSTIDTYKELYDVGYEQLTDIRRYQELKQKQYLTSEEQVEVSNLATKLANFLFTSTDINKVTGSLTTMQKYFRDKTIPQLEAWKQEIVDYNTEYQTLSQTISQSWTTTSATTYDIHKGNETLDSSVELKLDSSSNLTVIVDGVVIAYDKYEIRTNTSGKKTMIAFVGYTPASGKRMEARWSYASRQFVVGNHQHNKSDINGLPTVATTGSYNDLTNIPSTFNPSSHTHTWSQISNKPATFPPSSHTHDDRYYTESEMDSKLKGKSDTGHKHAISEVTGLQGEIDSLKSTVVNGKTSVANAINGKAGTSLSNQSTFNEMATAINGINVGGTIASIGSLGTELSQEYTTSVTLNNVSILGITSYAVRMYCDSNKAGKVYANGYYYSQSFAANNSFIVGTSEDSDQGSYSTKYAIVVFEEPATVKLGSSGSWKNFKYTKIL